jgi:hypothetical protein
MSARRDGTFARADFTYDLNEDHYTCPAGKVLKRRCHYGGRDPDTPHADGFFRYRASKLDCDARALKPLRDSTTLALQRREREPSTPSAFGLRACCSWAPLAPARRFSPRLAGEAKVPFFSISGSEFVDRGFDPLIVTLSR